ncbi:MAG: hypothetical protein R2693_06635 [Nocardioidaceae bacterium]
MHESLSREILPRASNSTPKFFNQASLLWTSEAHREKDKIGGNITLGAGTTSSKPPLPGTTSVIRKALTRP